MTTTSSSSTPEPLLDLQRLVAGIRWRRRVWMSMGLLGLLAGALLAVLVPPPPTAVARLLIIHESDEGAVADSLMATEVALLETTQIAAAALEKLNLNERPEDFLKEYSGEGLTGNVLQLTVHGSDDRDAVARAQALAEVFIADHIQRIQASADADAQALMDRRAQTEAELAQVDDSIAVMTAAGAAGDSASGLEALNTRRKDLTLRIQELGQQAQEAEMGAPRVAAGTQIVDSPRAVTDPFLVTGAKYAAVALILGLGTGLTLAAVASVVQDRPVLRRDIAAHLGASVIAQLPAPRRGPARLWRRSRGVAERKRVAATLVRIIRDDPGAVSLLELGCPSTATALALDIAEEFAVGHPIVVVDNLPNRPLSKLSRNPDSPIRILDSAQRPAGEPVAAPPERQLGVGSIRPGTAWTDLRQLGSETLLVVLAGHASTLWLHTVARQLADAQIPVIGVVLVHPDPRDHSDGTLWDALHTALRGRVARHAGSAPTDDDTTDRFPTVGPNPPKTVEIL